MKIGTVIKNAIEDQRRTQKWVAEQLNMDYKTFSGKLMRNSITADELLKISEILEINLEDLKKQITLRQKPLHDILAFRKKDGEIIKEEPCIIEDSEWKNVKEKMIRLAVLFTDTGAVSILNEIKRIQINFDNYDDFFESCDKDIPFSFLIGFKADGIDNDKIIQNAKQENFSVYKSIWRLDLLPEGRLQKIEFYEVEFSEET